jgi:integrase
VVRQEGMAMALIDLWDGARTGTGKHWEVRYRAAGSSRRKRFASKDAALDFEAKLRLEPEEAQALAGRTLTVDQLMDTWLATKAGLPGLKTGSAYRTDHREVLLTFRGRLARNVLPSDIRIWLARDRGVSLRTRSLTALRQAYRIAVADGLLKRDPTEGIRAPKAEAIERRYLSWPELRALADENTDCTALVWLLGTVGLRLGEAVGLQARDVQDRRLNIRRQVTMQDGRQVVGPPKGGKAREVPILPWVRAMLPTEGRKPDEWLFLGARGGRLNADYFRADIFKPAALAAGLGDLDPHELRHTAASLAIASGADVGVVQRMLGHASASITLNLYRHLFEDRLDEVIDSMEIMRRNALGEAA